MNKKLAFVFRGISLLLILSVFAACAPSAVNEAAPVDDVESVSKDAEKSETSPDEEAVEEAAAEETAAEEVEAIEIPLWFHGGTAEESELNHQQVKRFNAMQSTYKVVITEIPGGAVAGSGYSDSVNAAAVAGKLPCILDLDGPNLYNYAWAGYLLPLDDYMSEELKDDLLPSLIDQGTYNGQMFAIGQYDSGLALVGRKSMLEEAGVRIPTGIDDAWTFEEFNDALAKVKELPGVSYSIDLKLNYGAGEWYSYAFSPIVQGFGGDLIDRSTYETAEGYINGPEAVAAMTWFQELFEKGYATATPPDDNEFINGKAALGFAGHWNTSSYFEAFGDDVIILPVPQYPEKQVTGMGSWAWSITSSCPNPDGAWEYLNFILEPEEILAITDFNGAVPGRNSALATSELFGEGGKLNVFVQQLQNGVAVPRPITPGYPAVTVAFYTAADNIIKGGDVQKELDAAADKIDQDIQDHNGYVVQ